MSRGVVFVCALVALLASGCAAAAPPAAIATGCPARALERIQVCAALLGASKGSDGALKVAVGRGFDLCSSGAFAAFDQARCLSAYAHAAAVAERWDMNARLAAVPGRNLAVLCATILAEPVDGRALVSPRAERRCLGTATTDDDRFDSEPAYTQDPTSCCTCDDATIARNEPKKKCCGCAGGKTPAPCAKKGKKVVPKKPKVVKKKKEKKEKKKSKAQKKKQKKSKKAKAKAKKIKKAKAKAKKAKAKKAKAKKAKAKKKDKKKSKAEKKKKKAKADKKKKKSKKAAKKSKKSKKSSKGKGKKKDKKKPRKPTKKPAKKPAKKPVKKERKPKKKLDKKPKKAPKASKKQPKKGGQCVPSAHGKFPYSSGTHVVVDLALQRLRVYSGARLVKEYVTSSGLRGAGNGKDQSPVGRFSIGHKGGAGAALGTDMVNIIATSKRTPQSGKAVMQTRVLTLIGLEASNKHALSTGIFIHGTNHPQTLGKPSSAGCFRLSNKDVVDFYNRVAVGTRVTVSAKCAWPQ